MIGFYEKVYGAVRQIPKGRVATYGQIALLCGSPRAARAVGYALHCNPDQSTIPCHRVVNRRGALAPEFAFGGKEAQGSLLAAEGVDIGDDFCVDLEKYLWRE